MGLRRVILGPPGTGKTTRLVGLARELCPARALFVSHTRAAAQELKKRTKLAHAQVGTLHSVCFRQLGVISQQVVDDTRRGQFLTSVGLRADDPNTTDIMSILARAHCTGVQPREIYDRTTRPCSPGALDFYGRSYAEWKKSYGLLDFNDMLSEAVGEDFPYTSLFVDEAQDLSPLHWAVVMQIASKCENVVVAGDDDQAIFEWGGADPHGMSRHLPDYPREVLQESFRVPSLVHALAEGISGRISVREAKSYRPREQEGVLDEVGGLAHLDWEGLSGGSGTVVLYRDVAARADIEGELVAARVPFRSLSGAPAPYDWGVARAYRTLKACTRGESVPKRDWDNMASILEPSALASLRAGRAQDLAAVRLVHLFQVPAPYYDYFAECDLVTPPKVRLSTIHNFKGAEESRVVLYTGLSERVSAGFAVDPDPEHRVWYVGVTRARDWLTVVHGANEYPL